MVVLDCHPRPYKDPILICDGSDFLSSSSVPGSYFQEHPIATSPLPYGFVFQDRAAVAPPRKLRRRSRNCNICTRPGLHYPPYPCWASKLTFQGMTYPPWSATSTPSSTQCSKAAFSLVLSRPDALVCLAPPPHIPDSEATCASLYFYGAMPSATRLVFTACRYLSDIRCQIPSPANPLVLSNCIQIPTTLNH